MNFEIIYTLSIVFLALLLLYKDKAPADMAFLGALLLLNVGGIISVTEAFAGFSNSGLIIIAALFVVTAALKETGVLDGISQKILGNTSTEKGALKRLALSIIPSSAFLNNTPIVAMFMPIVVDWCHKHRVAPSKLLIPISFFAILGGTCTLIGTSTNIIVNDLLIEAGLPPFTLFELAAVGIPYAIAGSLYIIFRAPKALPSRNEMFEQVDCNGKDYLFEMVVSKECEFIGEDAFSKMLVTLAPGCTLLEVGRQGEVLKSKDVVIAEGDHLIFKGRLSCMIKLAGIPGLISASDRDQEGRTTHQEICEVVISGNSPLLKQTVRNSDFKNNYGATLIAVHRFGETYSEKIQDMVLKAGDTLLLKTKDNFVSKFSNNRDFYMVNGVGRLQKDLSPTGWKKPFSLIVFVLMLAFMTTGYLPLVSIVLMAAMLLIATGAVSVKNARKSVDWSLLVSIAAAFGIGKAMENSGAASLIADAIVSLSSYGGPIMALLLIYITGSLLTEIVTNNAAAILLFPLCIKVAEAQAVDSRPFIVAMTFAASACFLSPIGYQTNLMVYGPGGYKVKDFFKFGLPLSILLTIISMLLIPLFWKM